MAIKLSKIKKAANDPALEKTVEEAKDAKPGLVIEFLKSELSPADVELTEDAIAERFAVLYGGSLRFDHTIGKWYVWDGVRWKVNRTERAYDFARLLCREHRGDKRLMGSKKAAEGVEHMARRDQRLAVTSEIWDSDPFVIGTPGGTIDLRTGELRASKREDYITRITAVAPAPKSTPCPAFSLFLQQITQGDEGFARLLQQWAGYCLTGDTSEHCLLFIYGTGCNGKTVFANLLREIMREYATSAAMQTFAASKHTRHLAEIAVLDGVRFVVASETEKGQEWSQSRINELTGGDSIKANLMRQDPFEFTPRLKLVLLGNHKPKLGSVNDAARRRLIIVPFNYKPKVPDKQLRSKLQAEYPAILRWMIDGCLDWQANGLMRPDIVLKATADYFEEQDLFTQWLDEKCDLGVGKKERASDLFKSWEEFAEGNGEEAGSLTTFGPILAQHFEKKKTKGSNCYLGIALKSVASLKIKNVEDLV